MNSIMGQQVYAHCCGAICIMLCSFQLASQLRYLLRDNLHHIAACSNPNSNPEQERPPCIRLLHCCTTKWVSMSMHCVQLVCNSKRKSSIGLLLQALCLLSSLLCFRVPPVLCPLQGNLCLPLRVLLKTEYCRLQLELSLPAMTRKEGIVLPAQAIASAVMPVCAAFSIVCAAVLPAWRTVAAPLQSLPASAQQKVGSHIKGLVHDCLAPAAAEPCCPLLLTAASASGVPAVI